MNGRKRLNSLASNIMLFLLIHNHIDTLNMPRRSRRVIRPPVKLALMGESSLTILESHEDDPTGYYEAINDKDFGF